MNRWLMQSVGIHEFAMGNLNPRAQKLVVFAQRSPIIVILMSSCFAKVFHNFAVLL